MTANLFFPQFEVAMTYQKKFIEKYGKNVRSFNKSGVMISEARCFIQPLRYKNKMYLQGTPTETGFNSAGYYLLIAPADFDCESIGLDGYIADSDKNFHVDRCEKVYLGNDVFYIWAVLREVTNGSYPVYRHFK